MIKGENVNLVTLEKHHLDDIMKGWNNPEMRRFLGGFIPHSRENEASWIESVARAVSENSAYQFVIEKSINNSFLGTCGTHIIDWKARSTEIGIAIHDPKNWGKGYGSEALNLLIQYLWNNLNLRRIELSGFEFNTRAIAVYKKLGFTEYGRATQKYYVEGKYVDTIYMELLREY